MVYYDFMCFLATICLSIHISIKGYNKDNKDKKNTEPLIIFKYLAFGAYDELIFQINSTKPIVVVVVASFLYGISFWLHYGYIKLSAYYFNPIINDKNISDKEWTVAVGNEIFRLLTIEIYTGIILIFASQTIKIINNRKTLKTIRNKLKRGRIADEERLNEKGIDITLLNEDSDNNKISDMIDDTSYKEDKDIIENIKENDVDLD